MSNLTTARAIGAGLRLTETAADAIVATLTADALDPMGKPVPKVIRAAVVAWTLLGHEGPAPKQATGPKGEQTRTDYGRGVDALTKAVTRALTVAGPKPVRLAVTMSGDDAPATGTVTVDPSHPLYAELVAMIAAASASE